MTHSVQTLSPSEAGPFIGQAPVDPNGGPEAEPTLLDPVVPIAGAAALTHEGIAHPNRLSRLMASHEIKAASAATFRLLGNLAISAIDAIPVIGNVFEWAVDASKTFKSTDIFTPNVKRRWAWGTELLEGVELFGIPMPSHLVETSMQFWHDRKSFIPGFRAAFAILRNKDIRPQQN